MARPVLTYEKRHGETGDFTVTSSSSGAPTLLATWTLARDASPSLETLGFRFVTNLVAPRDDDDAPHQSTRIKIVIGGGPDDLVGVSTVYWPFTDSGIMGSDRMEVDVSSLWDGRDMEFVKVFGYRTQAGFTAPSSNNYSLMMSGPVPVPVDTCGLPFYFDSVQTLDSQRLRLWFTRAPNPATADPANFTLTGTSGQDAPAITMVTRASDDTDVYDLYLSAPMLSGTYTLTIADAVNSESLHELLEPKAHAFDWTPIAQEPIAHGAANASAEDQFLKNLNPAFRDKPNWKALAAGLAAGDAMTREDARLAFDQLFIMSASGKYLVRRAGDNGIAKPEGPGLSDDVFRKLALIVKNSKLTAHAMLDVLDVFYGTDATHAYAETTINEPFHITAGSTLEVLVDEKTDVTVEFARRDFTTVLRATASEVAAVITRALEARRTRAWAVPFTDPDTGLQKVRIYSGTQGLTSSIRIAGGTAQPALLFPRNLFPEPEVAPVDFGDWTVTKPDTQTARWTYDGTFFDFQDLQVGDYVVIRGIEFDAANRGSGAITAVNFAVGAMWFEVENPSGVAEGPITQCEYGDLEIFRAIRHTIYDSPAYALLFQHDGDGFATIAATTRAIERQKYSGAYLQGAAAIEGDTAVRDGDGVVTVETVLDHGMEVGDWFDLDSEGTLDGPGMTGRWVVASVIDPLTFTYVTVDHAFAATASGAFTVTPVAAPAGEVAGPFTFDPKEGLSLTGVDGTVQTRLEVGQRYALLQLGTGEGADFPDEEGWLVFRLGYSNQVGPVKYLGNTGADTLLIDADFKFPATIEAGSFVTLLDGKGPFFPGSTPGSYPAVAVGAFWATASPSGRVAAEATMRAISAEGIDLDIEIRYPGDRGLGGEGLPARRTRKLSDKAMVWGSDDLDAELEEERNGSQ